MQIPVDLIIAELFNETRREDYDYRGEYCPNDAFQLNARLDGCERYPKL